jgi:chromosome segregation ATPase
LIRPRKLAQQFRCLVKLCDQLDAVSSVEEMTAQAQSRLNVAKQALAKVEAETRRSKAARDAAIAKAAETEADHQEQANRLRANLSDMAAKLKTAQAQYAKVENARDELRRKIA